MENIKANELRIGNYVSDDDGYLYKVNGFKPFDHSVRCDEEEGCNILIDLYQQDGSIKKSYEIESYLCKPIPLTEEWLLKFGFKKWGNDDSPRTISYEFKGWSVFPPNSFCDFKNGFGFMWYKKDDNIESARVVIKHVHQLQNLYFVLTGEDLTFKSE